MSLAMKIRYEELKKSIGHLYYKTGSTQQTNDVYLTQIAVRDIEIENLNKTHEMNHNTWQMQQATIEEQERQIKQLQVNVNTMGRAIKKQEEQHKQLQEELASTNSAWEVDKERIQQLDVRCANQMLTLERHEMDKNRLEKKNVGLEEKIKRQYQVIINNGKELERKHKECTEMADIVTPQAIKIKELEDTIMKHEHSIATLEHDNKVCRGFNDQQRDEINKLEIKFSALNDKFTFVCDENQNLKKDIEMCSFDGDQWRSLAEEREAQIAKHTEEIKFIKHIAEEGATRLREENNHLIQKNNVQKEMLEANDVVELHNQLAAKDAVILKLKFQAEKRKPVVEEIKTKLLTLETQFQAVAEEHKRQTATILSQNNTIIKQTNTIMNLEEKIELQQQQLRDFQMSASRYDQIASLIKTNENTDAMFKDTMKFLAEFEMVRVGQHTPLPRLRLRPRLTAMRDELLHVVLPITLFATEEDRALGGRWEPACVDALLGRDVGVTLIHKGDEIRDALDLSHELVELVVV